MEKDWLDRINKARTDIQSVSADIQAARDDLDEDSEEDAINRLNEIIGSVDTADDNLDEAIVALQGDTA